MILLEQITIEDMLSGKESFRNFLFLVNKLELKFLKRGYLNTGDYYYFFFTESIRDNKVLLNELELKESLKASYLTLKKIKEKVLSFYVGVKGEVFEYGFYDVSRKIVYKTGKFEVTTSFFKKLPNHKCFKNVRKDLSKANLSHMRLLHKIKDDLENLWPESESRIKVVDHDKVKKSFPKKLFRLGDLNENLLANSVKKFSRDYKWYNKIWNYVVIGDEWVHFYFVIEK